MVGGTCASLTGSAYVDEWHFSSEERVGDGRLMSDFAPCAPQPLLNAVMF